ncbi:MAG: MBL fold metallo-hydrolase [Myxococcota bacterium]|jgi:metallo-beta-lactamase family protein|nr:MBL fold metallo-hydrolase [Myxococcota bacterium]
MQLSFHGAAQGVTGSCHLLEMCGKRILIDCGMFQGEREMIAENAKSMGFDPALIDVVVLTHAHLDHCGRLPLLTKWGFRGPIFATSATRALAKVVLLDSAHMQEEDARRSNRRASQRNARQSQRQELEGAGQAPNRQGHSEHRQARQELEPLYSVVDALDAIELFRRRPIHYGQRFELAPDLTLEFIDAGHILGSASVVIEGKERGKTRRLVFSGDIGSSSRPIVNDPTPPPEADVIVMETTYGDRDHRGFEDSVEELYAAVGEALERGGNVLIPTFALERAQELLVAFRLGIEQGKLPRHLDIALDSPMAISATEIYARHPEFFDVQSTELARRYGDPFSLPGLRFTRDGQQSRELNSVHHGLVVLAGSGMCTGGRIMHHLRHNLWREESTVILVSYAAPGTVARKLIDGHDRVELMGRWVDVRAKVKTINGFSAHAGRSELLQWRRAAGKNGVTYLVHGEDRVTQSFAEALRSEGYAVVDPEMHESYEG